MITGFERQSVYTSLIQCVIENGNIMQVDWAGNKQKIGVTNETYAELEKISNEYYNKLVELKVIIPPKTPEQIQAETMQIMQNMMDKMQQMQNELEVLKNAKSSDSGQNAGNEQRAIPKVKPSLGTSSADSKSSNDKE